MASLVLVVGGVRSGKSRLAEELARSMPAVTYLATATLADPADAEMRERIRAHRERRPSHWRTVECPRDLAGATERHGRTDCLLIECVSLWLTNLMLGLGDLGDLGDDLGDDPQGRAALGDEAIKNEVERLIAAIHRVPAKVIAVSNEVGWGVIPENALARRFGDRLGEINQQLAAAADEVHLCVAGLSMRLK